jgi:hypothetical protein
MHVLQEPQCEPKQRNLLLHRTHPIELFGAGSAGEGDRTVKQNDGVPCRPDNLEQPKRVVVLPVPERDSRAMISMINMQLYEIIYD